MKKIGTALLAGATAVCGIAAVWFGISFYSTLQEYERGDEDMKRMYEVMGGIPKPTSNEETDEEDAHSRRQRLENYQKLKDENSDMAGWIRIDGTSVNYPVMHTPENPDFYLKRGFDKKSSAYGMIYMDAGCSLETGCPNYVLYGHHMKNGSMFALIEGYAAREFYEDNPVIGFDTLESIDDYEVAAAFRCPASMINEEFNDMLAARTKEAYSALIDYSKVHGFYDTGITPRWPEQLVTLATCEYSDGDGRFFVIARKKKAE